MSYSELLKLLTPEIIVTITALVVLTVGLSERALSTSAYVVCRFLVRLGLLVAIVAVVWSPVRGELGSGMFVVTPFTSLFKIVVLLLVLFVVIVSAQDSDLRHPPEYLAIILFATLGLMLLIASDELLSIFIALELLGLSLYILTAFDKTNPSSAEAGMKYFLFGSTASAFTLFGISLIYGVTATTQLSAIPAKLAAAPIQPLLAIAIIMTLVGFMFKIAAAPFHLWAPDAYQGGPVSSAALIASASKVASFVVLGKIVLLAFAPLRGNPSWHSMTAGWSPLLAAIAALSILLGNLAALTQTNVRRLLAYSAVAHAGYTLLGLIAGGGNGFAATMFYTTIYAFTLVGAFAVCGVVRQQTGGDDVINFSGLASRSPTTALCMAIFLLSLAGLPPLAGFFGKFFLFSAALSTGGRYGLAWLVIIALFGSFVSLYYYLIVLKAVFVAPVAKMEGEVRPPGFAPIVTVIFSAAIILTLGLAPQLLLGRIAATIAP